MHLKTREIYKNTNLFEETYHGKVLYFVIMQDKENASGTSSSGTTSCEDLPGTSGLDRDCLDFRSTQKSDERHEDIPGLLEVQIRPNEAKERDKAKMNEGSAVNVESLSAPGDETEPAPQQESSDLCYFCGQRVYLIDRLSAEGHFFHR